MWEVIGGNPAILNKLCTASVAGDVEQKVFQVLVLMMLNVSAQVFSMNMLMLLRYFSTSRRIKS